MISAILIAGATPVTNEADPDQVALRGGLRHEIGHLFGIRHAPSGLMRASLEADDDRAQKGEAALQPAEASRMRIAALLAGEERLRSSAAGSPPNPWRQ